MQKPFIFVMLVLLLAACSAPAEPETAAGAAAGATPRPTNSPGEPTPLPTATAVFTLPPTAAESAAAASPTLPVTPPATPFPSPTAVPATLLTPAPHAPDVAQPPYAESACSDRFPCNDDTAAWEARIQVPDGFSVTYFAYLPNAEDAQRGQQITSMTFGPDGLLYASTAQGNIYAIDESGEAALFFSGLTVPTGLAFLPGTDRLYVSNRVLDLNVEGEAQISVISDDGIRTLFDGLPCCYIGMHGPNGIAFGPDGYGYVGVGGRADHGEVLDGSNRQDALQPWEASILRFSPDGEEIEVYARGFRNPYDLGWDANGQLWAGDNGRDGNPHDGDIVPDELHIVVPGGEHGYPYYECPACYGIPADVDLIAPLYEFEPHSVPVGVAPYLAEQFPGYYNSMFVALWTALPFAERVMRFTADGTASTFATGFAAPMDVTVGPDGSLYVGDFATGIIFKISYTS